MTDDSRSDPAPAEATEVSASVDRAAPAADALVVGRPLAACTTCSEIASERDDWCAVCGTALRGVRVSPAEIVVTETSLAAAIEVVAEGVLPTTFVVPRRLLMGAPKWVTPQVVPDVAISLEPGDVHVVNVVFSPAFLPQGRRQDEEPGHYELPFTLASLGTDASGRAERKRALISFVSPSRARVTPAYAHTRLLPQQRLTGGRRVERTVTLHNAGGHQTRLLRVFARDTAASRAASASLAVAGESASRLSASALVVCPPLSASRVIAAGDRFSQTVAFQLSKEAAAVDGPRAFDIEVVFELEENGGGPREQRRHQVCARVAGVVAAAPDVTLAAAVLPVRTHGGRTAVEVKIENPGAAAVTLSDVVIADEEGEIIERQRRDWLQLSPRFDNPVIIEAGQSETLAFTVDPDRREGGALKQAWGERQITLRHDGWQEDESERQLSFRLSAELGEVVALQGAVVGIDFGTSSSAVSLLHGESGRAFALPLEPEQGRDELPSVLFYRGDDPPFLYGTEAENAAPLAFSNVVRSIKSVVAKDPALTWAFFERQAKAGASQLRTFQSEELLSRFLREVKRRAELGVRKLPHAFLDSLDLTGRGVRLSKAVFTHPVAVTDEALRALYHAAKAAGLVEDDAAFETFVAQACLDEALAAVLAFIFVIAGDDAGAAAPLREKDAFTLLSVDVGGGTSDLAVVRVQGLARFLRGEGEFVEVELLANGGEGRLGGDDFDRALATSILDRLEAKKEARGCDLDGVRRALSHPSFESYRRSESGHHEMQAHWQQVWAARSSLLRICEAQKCALGEQAQVQLAPFAVSWPGDEAMANARGGVELTVTQKDAASVYAPLLARLQRSVTALLSDAGLGEEAIDAVLFTGKGSRLTPLADAVMEAFAGHAPLALRPQSVPAFDEKRCVATGAAVWGDSQSHGGGWLRVRKRAAHQLDAALTLRRGPRFAPIAGLEAGAPLPATGTVTLGTPTKTVVLYRQGRAALTFVVDKAVRELEVVVEDATTAYAIVDGARIDASAADSSA